jgi:hypothetical protein
MVKDWMFGLTFFVDVLTGDEIVEKFAVGIYTAQVRSYYTCQTGTTCSRTRADLALMYSTLCICLFLHSLRTVPTTRPPASRIWTHPDTRQPSG